MQEHSWSWTLLPPAQTEALRRAAPAHAERDRAHDHAAAARARGGRRHRAALLRRGPPRVDYELKEFGGSLEQILGLRDRAGHPQRGLVELIVVGELPGTEIPRGNVICSLHFRLLKLNLCLKHTNVKVFYRIRIIYLF